MSFDSLLETCIGLTLMYLLLSLLATTVNEHLSTLVGLRAATLKTGLQTLCAQSRALKPLLDHSLLARFKAPASPMVAGSQAAPSYLSGENFAKALVDVLGGPEPTAQGGTFQAVQKAVDDLPDDDALKGTLRSLLTTAGGDLDKLHAQAAGWFDQEMSHLQGFYKQRMHLISALIGLTMAVMLNADTIAVAHTLWRNPVLRTQLTTVSATLAPAGTEQGGTPTVTAQQISTQLQDFPIGWDDQAVTTLATGWDNWPQWKARLLAVAGWLITAMAISLGAPFWFDILGNLVNLRGGARPPAKAAGTT